VSEATLDLVRLDLDDPCLSLSPVMAEAVVTAQGPRAVCDHRPTVALIRRQRPYALLGPRDARLPDLDAGVAFLARRGLPAYMRIGGGSLVVLDEDCLSFAVAWPCRSPAHVGQAARALGAPALEAVRALGIDARMGAASGSYCEGPTDLVAPDGRKVAGMAVALRGGWALVSGMLLVCQDPRYATGVVRGFERAAGGPRAYRSEAVTRLCDLSAAAGTVDAVAAALEASLAAWAGRAGLPARVRRAGPAEAYAAGGLVGRRRLRAPAGAARASDG